eukprot:TRINITY_DN7524_c0_g1_i1.p2 TRINITY_DN7524_c0_g1~~TRINITY_DN7524_c0_g1_i1.p2  ORF type:complete len:220 (+),score=64.84 TRINITY_DN7524_c0_g1_i1:74-661(+)
MQQHAAPKHTPPPSPARSGSPLQVHPHAAAAAAAGARSPLLQRAARPLFAHLGTDAQRRYLEQPETAAALPLQRDSMYRQYCRSLSQRRHCHRRPGTPALSREEEYRIQLSRCAAVSRELRVRELAAWEQARAAAPAGGHADLELDDEPPPSTRADADTEQLTWPFPAVGADGEPLAELARMWGRGGRGCQQLVP